MSDADLLITGGLVVTPEGARRVHVAVADGRVHSVGPDRPASRETVDAAGLLLLPGGVDTHVHLVDPSSTEREDFPTGTAAAAAAGVTTLIEHSHGGPIREVAGCAMRSTTCGVARTSTSAWRRTPGPASSMPWRRCGWRVWRSQAVH